MLRGGQFQQAGGLPTLEPLRQTAEAVRKPETRVGVSDREGGGWMQHRPE